tara:strand:- start:1127 stop:1342 length:216 start_codon:yes stop_codon:yes gene_type:complete
MRLLTYILLLVCIVACKPEYKKKKEMREKRIEMRDSLKNYHPDSIVKYREKRLAKKKSCCTSCGCEDNDNT